MNIRANRASRSIKLDRSSATVDHPHLDRRGAWRTCGIPFAGLLAGVALLGAAEATPSSLPAKGSLTSQSVAGPGCTSPIGLCAVGEMKGTFMRRSP